MQEHTKETGEEFLSLWMVLSPGSSFHHSSLQIREHAKTPYRSIDHGTQSSFET